MIRTHWVSGVVCSDGLGVLVRFGVPTCLWHVGSMHMYMHVGDVQWVIIIVSHEYL